ncbi:amidohydrolase family protein [Mesorhizobium sp. PUT5]|uniref:amidohydrolase family protein n=1 Tax=Mesorhizobium sp. PUT5 TaxID=3454629 RepID=UPI003FA458BA
MIVDAHLHLFRNGYGRFRGASPLGGATDLEAYAKLMHAHGISAGLVVCYEGEDIDPANNAYVREIAAANGWISSVAYLAPGPAPSAERIDALLGAGHCGVALYLPDAAAAGMLRDWPPEVWRHLDRACAVVSFNARMPAIAQLGPLVERAPDCAFLFSHLGLLGKWDSTPTRAEAAARLAPLLRLAGCANVGVKLSGLYAVDPVPPHEGARLYVELLTEHFAPADLHWGSDFSPVLDFASFQAAMAVPGLEPLSAADRDLVFGAGLARKIGAAAGAKPDRA